MVFCTGIIFSVIIRAQFVLCKGARQSCSLEVFEGQEGKILNSPPSDEFSLLIKHHVIQLVSTTYGFLFFVEHFIAKGFDESSMDCLNTW